MYFSATNYYVDTISEQARVVLKKGVSWPTVAETRNANAYVVRYVAGYGGASDVPPPIVQAWASEPDESNSSTHCSDEEEASSKK